MIGLIVGIAFISLAAYVARSAWRTAGRGGDAHTERQRPLRDAAHERRRPKTG